MILKHRDTEVLRFDWVAPFGAKNVEVSSAAERFLPLSFRDRVRRDSSSLRYELETWLLGRTPPLRRAGIRDMLRHLGFNTEDADWARNLITFSRGLSLNDKTGYLPARGLLSAAEARQDVCFADIFSFTPHPEFAWPDNRLELSQYFLRNRIAKIIQFREKADDFIKIPEKSDTINRTKKEAEQQTNLDAELLGMLKLCPTMNTENLAELFKTTSRTIARHLKALQDSGQLKRVGSRKTGHWQVVELNAD